MDMLRLFLTAVMLGGGAFYCASCLYAFSGLFRRRGTAADSAAESPAVTVIIAARNEQDTIVLLLSDLLRQTYPEDRVEIAVVDDCSEDNTAAVVKGIAAEHPRLRLLSTRHSQSPYSHKKRAVHEGILSTDGEIIMTVDADCRVGGHWIEAMIGRFTPCIDLVAGEVIVTGGGLAGMTDMLEFAGIQSMAAGFMNAGFPLTCNGANLAYRRAAFDRAGGFDSIGKMVSGDDDLLMQKIAEGDPSRVVFVTERDAAVHTAAVESFAVFFERRARWASKITRYPSKAAVALLAVFFAYFTLIPVCLLLAVFGQFSAGFTAIGIGLKIAGEFPLVFYGLAKTGTKRLLLLFPFAEIVHIPYMIAVNMKGAFGTFKWRGRTARAISSGCREDINE